MQDATPMTMEELFQSLIQDSMVENVSDDLLYKYVYSIAHIYEHRNHQIRSQIAKCTDKYFSPDVSGSIADFIRKMIEYVETHQECKEYLHSVQYFYDYFCLEEYHLLRYVDFETKMNITIEEKSKDFKKQISDSAKEQAGSFSEKIQEKIGGVHPEKCVNLQSVL